MLGMAVYAATAVYDQAVLDERPIAPDEAATVLVDTLYRPLDGGVWRAAGQGKGRA